MIEATQSLEESMAGRCERCSGRKPSVSWRLAPVGKRSEAKSMFLQGPRAVYGMWLCDECAGWKKRWIPTRGAERWRASFAARQSRSIRTPAGRGCFVRRSNASWNASVSVNVRPTVDEPSKPPPLPAQTPPRPLPSLRGLRRDAFRRSSRSINSGV